MLQEERKDEDIFWISRFYIKKKVGYNLRLNGTRLFKDIFQVSESLKLRHGEENE